MLTTAQPATAAAIFNTPLGSVRAESNPDGIHRLEFIDITKQPRTADQSQITDQTQIANRAVESLSLRPGGPEVRCRGWSESASGTPGKPPSITEPRRGDTISHEHLSGPVPDPASDNAPTTDNQPARRHLDLLQHELTAYFNGTLRIFTTPLAPQGTPFQHRVWNELRAIPHGETISYATLATRLADPNATRAVARANAQNPIAILIPCHRVIAKDGTLTGYAAGLDRKQALLDHEGVHTLFARQSSRGIMPPHAAAHAPLP